MPILERIRVENRAPIDPLGSYVLYWMTAARRTRSNFGLQRAVELCRELGKPLVVLEALRVDYEHASDRLHAFVIEGMRDNARALSSTPAFYYPFVERQQGAGRGLLRELSSGAAVAVTDWFPAFFLPAMLRAAAAQCRVRLEAVDSNGLIPVALHGKAFASARGYRAFVQRTLRQQLATFPALDPLASLPAGKPEIAASGLERWPPADMYEDPRRLVSRLPIDHTVEAVDTRGGADAAHARLQQFVSERLTRYARDSSHPDKDATSHLSPYLHFGHIGTHEVFDAVMTHERWTTRKLGRPNGGAREGWWNVSADAEQFLDQLVVWRELAFNACAWMPESASYDLLPAWARATLEAHLDDPRPQIYSGAQLDAAATSDQVWNAAQNELRRTGWCHGYMRMVWGKRMLEWCAHPREALDTMQALMDRYALDGRDPVSYLNYGWVLGRYDRPWFERPIFGTVRCMTTESARKKLKMRDYLTRFSAPAPGRLSF